jgi:hypothetical protein
VHWNIPSNPVDFEQREGRVNRYAGHAVNPPGVSGDSDPWEGWSYVVEYVAEVSAGVA